MECGLKIESDCFEGRSLIPESLIKTESLEQESSSNESDSLVLNSEIELDKYEPALSTDDVIDEKPPQAIETVYIKMEPAVDLKVESEEPPAEGDTCVSTRDTARSQGKHTVAGAEAAPEPKPESDHILKARAEWRFATTVGDDLMTTEMLEGRKIYVCKVCPYALTNRANMRKHVVKHTTQRPYRCQSCPYRGKRPADLSRHVRTNHDGVKPFLCDKCPYRTSTADRLRVHSVTHTGERAFSCDECDYRSSRRSILQTHQAKHTGLKRYSCDRCEYKSACRSNFNRHVETHSENPKKPHRCNICTYRSASKREVVKHVMRSHSGERPVGCAHCEFRTVTKNDLARHLKRIHAEVFRT